MVSTERILVKPKEEEFEARLLLELEKFHFLSIVRVLLLIEISFSKKSFLLRVVFLLT